jgi:hypothetical protein
MTPSSMIATFSARDRSRSSCCSATRARAFHSFFSCRAASASDW